MAETIAWIGLGNMGRGMVKNMVQKGPQKTPLHVYNRTTSRATGLVATLESGKATVASSVEEAVKQASIIFICVGADPALLSIINHIISVLPKDSGKIVVDCTTVHPDTTKKEDELITSHGAAFVACPVFGAPAAADAGMLVSVMTGPPETVNKVKPYVQGVTSRMIIDMSGQEISRASLLKLLGNSFILNMVESLGEALVVAEKSGLGTDVYEEWVNAFFPGPVSMYCKRMLTGDYYNRDEPLFAVDLARKDLGHAMKIAEKSDMHMRSVEVTDGYLKDVKAQSGENGDAAAVYGAIRKDSGMKFENA